MKLYFSNHCFDLFCHDWKVSSSNSTQNERRKWDCCICAQMINEKSEERMALFDKENKGTFFQPIVCPYTGDKGLFILVAFKEERQRRSGTSVIRYSIQLDSSPENTTCIPQISEHLKVKRLVHVMEVAPVARRLLPKEQVSTKYNLKLMSKEIKALQKRNTSQSIWTLKHNHVL